MPRIAWCTDVHLNFLSPSDYESFLETVKLLYTPDALFITGDIAEAPCLDHYLTKMSDYLQVPIYFVLGNHDYYHGRISEVREWARIATENEENTLCWLPAKGVVPLSDTTAVVGVDGWGDGRLGNPNSSRVFLNDWLCIEELMHPNPMGSETHINKRVPQLQRLGDEEAASIRKPLEDALRAYEEVYVLTHVPPWKEATWHRGSHSDADWLPWFSCQAVGDVIVELAEKYPNKKITVLCGHTHGEGVSRIRDNVLVITGGARYRFPEVNRVLAI